MKFRTEIEEYKALSKIGYEKPIFMLGSCFTDNIGAIFKKYLFNVSMNPFGVTYNPMSIYAAIRSLMTKPQYKAEDLDHYNELYFSYDHYTKFSSPDIAVALKNINDEFLQAKKNLPSCGTLILTFGSAFIFELKENGRLVNNCHKLPSSYFRRRMLSVEEISSQYTDLIKDLLVVNPELQIIFTVSPVRHIKDGFIENQRSKASLLLAIRDLEQNFPMVTYFPAYEIMMDDLRDYRFYAPDLNHPNDQAIEYIWNYFKKTMLDEESTVIISKLDPILNSLHHRPLHPETQATQKFLKDTKEKIRNLKEKFPSLNWSELA